MNIKNRKAISPLITTLLLIAIAVAASVLTYSWVMSMVGSQSAQAQTQVRIDTVTWNSTAPTFKLLIRNTGSVAATIESISIRTNTAGSTATIYVPSLPAAIDVGVTLNTGPVTFKTTVNFKWAVSTSYVIRVVTSTGFYYESVATTPSTGAPP